MCPISSREGGAIGGYFCKIESKGIDHILQSNAFLDLLFYMYVLSIVVCPFVLFLLTIVFSVDIRILIALWYLQTIISI